MIKNNLNRKLLIKCIVAVLICMLLASYVPTWSTNFSEMSRYVYYEREKILFFIFVYITIHFVFGIKDTFQCFFKYRWIVALLVMIFIVSNKYHGDSIGIYDQMIQPNNNSEDSELIWGELLPIRSDEWGVTSPQYLSTRFLDNPFSKYSHVLRGEDTLNPFRMSLHTLADLPQLVCSAIYAFCGFEYSFSFYWYINYVLGFMFTLELCYIVSGKRKLISLAGASMIILSAFEFWWGPSDLLVFAPASLVSFYYFFESDTRLNKVIFAFLTSAMTADFIMVLYPAWQVPMVYVMASILIWMIFDKWDVIKKQRAFEWSLIGAAFVLLIVFVVSFLYNNGEYIEAISNTVYPGQRVELGGGNIKKMFNFIYSPLFGLKDVTVLNVSEQSMILSFFPIPMLLAVYSWFKCKKIDSLSLLLFFSSFMLFVYVHYGFPEGLAKLTLMSYSTWNRAPDMLAYAQVFLFVRMLGVLDQSEKINRDVALVLSITYGILVVIIANKSMPDYLSTEYALIASSVLMVIVYCAISNNSKQHLNFACGLIIVVSVLSICNARPISKGVGAVDDNPVAEVIGDLSKDGSKWIAYGGSPWLQSFAVACGAPTINNVNTYPNIEMFRKLDTENLYDEIYNRYCHINIDFTAEDTSFGVIQSDFITVSLSYKDIYKTEADYILSIVPIEVENEYVEFDCIYMEDGIFIYDIVYADTAA